MSRHRALALTVALAFALAPTGAATPAEDGIARVVGQSIMTGMNGRTPSAELLARIRAGQVGGVILFAHNVGTPDEVARLVATLQSAAAAGGNPALLVAVDQEGGAVKRLPDGPPDRSAAAIGRDGSPTAARQQGEATAAYLRRLGIDVDLAPVLDTPGSGPTFLGSRAFSRNRWLNARLGAAFVEGLQAGGVAATAKHFPGLGTARRSTDAAPVVLATPKPVLDRRLVPFTRAIDAGAKLVMVSSAGYAAYDASGRPAVLSRPIVTGLLREQLGFDGVVISDAMEAAALRSRPHAAVGALAAGVDVLLYTSERTSAAGYREVLAAAREGRLELASRGARIAALKGWLAMGRPTR
jgi:beta-N-acetylhexosaminidase